MHQLVMAARHRRSVALAAAMGLAATLTVVSAATPDVRVETSSPAAIYEGTCDDLGSSAAFTLDELATDSTATRTGAGGAATVVTSTSTVDAALADLLAAPHAIAVSLSADDETTAACGDIGGYETDEQLAIGLAEVDNSGVFGVATLQGAGDRTEVVLYLATRAAGDEATPIAKATPAAAAESVTIALFRFKPTELQITAGTTVVWTQTDAVPHTVTAVDGSFDSGSLVKGDTFRHTFDTPGTYPYVCDFHGSMKATVIVE